MILEVKNTDTGITEKVKIRKEGAKYFISFLDSMNKQEFEADFERCGSFYSVIIEGKPYMMKFTSDGTITTVSVGSKYGRLNVEDEETKARRELRESFSTKTNVIISKIPGKVMSLLVKEGDTIKEGDLVLVLEAMKMENQILAPRDGIVKETLVKKGDNIPAWTDLLTYKD